MKRSTLAALGAALMLAGCRVGPQLVEPDNRADRKPEAESRIAGEAQDSLSSAPDQTRPPPG